MTSGRHRLVETIEQDPSLVEPHRLRQRVEALDRLEACFSEEPHNDADGLARRARELRARLETVNHELFETIRGEIRRGDGRVSEETAIADNAHYVRSRDSARLCLCPSSI